MNWTQPAKSIRNLATRVLAAGALVVIYSLSTLAVTGVVLSASVTPAAAQRGRGRGRGGRGGGGGRGRGRGIGPAIGIGIGAAIVGGMIAAEAARRQEAVEYCMRRFRSYNPETGTYIGRDGRPRPCP